MIDLIRRSFYIGVGALALSRDRVDQFITDSVTRGELTAEQGRTLVDEITHRADQERSRVETMVRQQVQRALDVAGLASRHDLSRLESRVVTLEARLRLLDTSAPAGPSSFSDPVIVTPSNTGTSAGPIIVETSGVEAAGVETSGSEEPNLP